MAGRPPSSSRPPAWVCSLVPPCRERLPHLPARPLRAWLRHWVGLHDRDPRLATRECHQSRPAAMGAATYSLSPGFCPSGCGRPPFPLSSPAKHLMKYAGRFIKGIFIIYMYNCTYQGCESGSAWIRIHFPSWTRFQEGKI